MISKLQSLCLGAADYYRFPEFRCSWGGPFNGQICRRKLYKSIIAEIAPAAIIETGTYRGTTTEFMAESGLPTYSVEGVARNYGFSQARLWRRRNVHLYLGDSRTVLRRLFAGRLKAMRKRPVFAYLDAHWNADLPLREELEIIFNHCPEAVVMIDDFQVPNDGGYKFDDYGLGKCLSPSYLEPVMSTYCLEAHYPSSPSFEETGAKRGCVVLGDRQTHGTSLRIIPLLRRDNQNLDVTFEEPWSNSNTLSSPTEQPTAADRKVG